MGPIRKFGVAIVLASVMAGGLGTTVSAANNKPGNSNAAICTYLQSIIEYPGVNEAILRFALSLFAKYNCTAQ